MGTWCHQIPPLSFHQGSPALVTFRLASHRSLRVSSLRLVKRRRALRGRNPIRNNQADGAPMALGLGTLRAPRPSVPIGHRSHASENPEGLGAAPPIRTPHPPPWPRLALASLVASLSVGSPPTTFYPCRPPWGQSHSTVFAQRRTVEALVGCPPI